MKAIFTLLILVFVTPIAMGDDKPIAKRNLEGVWEGTMQAGAISLRMGVVVSKKDDGYTAIFYSIDQGSPDIPLNSFTLKDDKVEFSLVLAAISYGGKLSTNGDKIEGEFKQGAQKFSLDFTRRDKRTSLLRPQQPKKPYPYLEENVTFPSKAKDVTLAGTLTKPKGEGPFPAVILITGSGPQDRDETLLGHKPFLVLADHFTRQGIAVLRYDDRGVAKSTGKFATATSRDFADDAVGDPRHHLRWKRVPVRGHPVRAGDGA